MCLLYQSKQNIIYVVRKNHCQYPRFVLWNNQWMIKWLKHWVNYTQEKGEEDKPEMGKYYIPSYVTFGDMIWYGGEFKMWEYLMCNVLSKMLKI